MKLFYEVAAIFVLFSSVFALNQSEFEKITNNFSMIMEINQKNRILNAIETLKNELKSRTLSKKQKLFNNVKIGILYHNIAKQGIKDRGHRLYSQLAADRLLSVFQSLDRNSVLLPIVEVYLGSSLAMEGRDIENPVEKIQRVKEGLNYLNDAVKRFDSFYYLPRYVRGIVCATLPDFFKQKEIAINDFLTLEKRFNKNRSTLSNNKMAVVYQQLGNLYKNDGKIMKALEYWLKAKKVDHGGKVSKEIDKQIKVYGE